MILVYLEVMLMITMAIAASICMYLNLILHQKKYAHYVVFDQPTKLEQRLLNHPCIYFLGTLLFVIFFSWILVNYIEDNAQQFFFGAFISLFSIGFGNALGGILIFIYTLRNHEKISGQVIFEDKMFLSLHLQSVLMSCLTLLISLTIIYQTPFMLGSLIAVIIMSLRPLVQLFKH